MSRRSTPPSTVAGIKRLGIEIKREHEISHSLALDLAAKEAGFQNFRHASSVLSAPVVADTNHTAHLTAYWVKPRGEYFERGRLTLSVQLSKPLDQTVSRHQLMSARHLAGFRIEAQDHLELKLDIPREEEGARETLEAAARTLRFLAATGLRPATTQRERWPLLSRFETLPGADHYSLWIDRNGDWIYMDEPYNKPELAERASWSERNGMTMVRPAWEGLYSPQLTVPFFFCDNETVATSVADAIARLTNGTPGTWEVGSYDSEFVSPARAALDRPRRRRPMPAVPGLIRNGALPYGNAVGGSRSLWRPAKPMGVSSHREAAYLLKALLVYDLEYRQTMAVGKVRSTLDNWISLEHKAGLGESLDLYYGGANGRPLLDGPSRLAAVRRVREILSAGYQSCRPREFVLNSLSIVEAALKRETS